MTQKMGHVHTYIVTNDNFRFSQFCQCFKSYRSAWFFTSSSNLMTVPWKHLFFFNVLKFLPRSTCLVTPSSLFTPDDTRQARYAAFLLWAQFTASLFVASPQSWEPRKHSSAWTMDQNSQCLALPHTDQHKTHPALRNHHTASQARSG